MLLMELLSLLFTSHAVREESDQRMFFWRVLRGGVGGASIIC